MPDGSSFFTPEELIARYKGQISVKTLANWRTKGGGPPYVKIGGKVMYPCRAVLTWEFARVYGSTADRIEMTEQIQNLSNLVFGPRFPTQGQATPAAKGLD